MSSDSHKGYIEDKLSDEKITEMLLRGWRKSYLKSSDAFLLVPPPGGIACELPLPTDCAYQKDE